MSTNSMTSPDMHMYIENDKYKYKEKAQNYAERTLDIYDRIRKK